MRQPQTLLDSDEVASLPALEQMLLPIWWKRGVVVVIPNEHGCSHHETLLRKARRKGYLLHSDDLQLLVAAVEKHYVPRGIMQLLEGRTVVGLVSKDRERLEEQFLRGSYELDEEPEPGGHEGGESGPQEAREKGRKPAETGAQRTAKTKAKMRGLNDAILRLRQELGVRSRRITEWKVAVLEAELRDLRRLQDQRVGLGPEPRVTGESSSPVTFTPEGDGAGNVSGHEPGDEEVTVDVSGRKEGEGASSPPLSSPLSDSQSPETSQKDATRPPSPPVPVEAPWGGNVPTGNVSGNAASGNEGGNVSAPPAPPSDLPPPADPVLAVANAAELLRHYSRGAISTRNAPKDYREFFGANLAERFTEVTAQDIVLAGQYAADPGHLARAMAKYDAKPLHDDGKVDLKFLRGGKDASYSYEPLMRLIELGTAHAREQAQRAAPRPGPGLQKPPAPPPQLATADDLRAARLKKPPS